MHVFGIASTLRRRHRTRGQSLVEFALILPLLLVFLAAVLDLGRVYYAHISLLNAAREGAFQAAKTPDSFQSGQPCNTSTNLVVCRVQLESKGSMVEVADADISLSCSVSGCPKQDNSTVTVGVSGTFDLITPLLGFIFGGQTIDLDTQATTQIEYFPATGVATLPPGPVAVLTADDTTPDVGQTVTFDASATSGSPTGWEWDFGDGNTTTGSAVVTHSYSSGGSYTVTVRAINLAGDDTETITITVATPTPTPTPTGTTGPTPTPSPTPSPTPEVCAYPPNVIGKAPGVAESELAGDGWNFVNYGDMTTGQKNKIQAQNPDHTTCTLKSTTTIVMHYRPN